MKNTAIGRALRMKTFKTQGENLKYFLTLEIKNEKSTDFVQFEGFATKEELKMIKKDDRLKVEFILKNDSYEGKDGKIQYKQYLLIDNVSKAETKATKTTENKDDEIAF